MSQALNRDKSKYLSQSTNISELLREAYFLIRDLRAQKAYGVQQRILGFDVAANDTRYTHKGRTRTFFFDPVMLQPTKSTGIDHFTYSVALYTH